MSSVGGDIAVDCDRLKLGVPDAVEKMCDGEREREERERREREERGESKRVCQRECVCAGVNMRITAFVHVCV